MELLYTLVSEFKGKRYPDIPLPFERTELPEQAFFATLPIGQVGARSRNQRTYSRKAVESIVAYVNRDHPCGWWGHPEHEARTQVAPAIQWLGAVIDDEGVAWGKCVALTTEATELLRMAKLTNSQIGTSVYGEAEMDGETVTDMKLMYIDLLAAGEWVGVPITATVPILTAETKPTGESMELQELAAQLATAIRERDEAQRALTQTQALVAEAQTLRPAADQLQRIRTTLAESADMYASLNINIQSTGDDLADIIGNTIKKLQALLANQLLTQIGAAVEAAVKVADLRPIVLEMVKPGVKTEADIQPCLTAALAQPYLQALNAKLVAAEAGPPAVTSATPPVSTNAARVEQAVAAAPKNAQRMGLLNPK